MRRWSSGHPSWWGRGQVSLLLQVTGPGDHLGDRWVPCAQSRCTFLKAEGKRECLHLPQ